MAADKIVWNTKVRQQYANILNYIADNSIRNAENVRDEIQQKLTALLLHPKKYPADKYKIGNDGNYRAFTVFQYRLSYRIKGKEIQVLSIRHSKMLPEQH